MKEEYWRSHCLAMTARSAVERLRARLTNHRLLTQISFGDAVKEVSAAGTVSNEVPFSAARCKETISRRREFDITPWSGESDWEV